MTTKVTINVDTKTMEYRVVKQGTFFRYNNTSYVRTCRMVHAGTNIEATCMRLSDGQMTSMDGGNIVEVFNEAEVSLK